MSWYELTSDVMVRGTPRSFGEVLDLTESEGQLLSGLGRAKPAQRPAPPEPVCPMPKPEAVEPEASVEDLSEPAPAKTAEEPAPVAPAKQAARRRAPSPSPKD